MKDYVVNFVGNDSNLSDTIDKVKKSLGGIEDKASKLDEIDAKFKKIQGSAHGYMLKVKQIQNLMALMNVNGLGETDLYNRMAQEAANYVDAVGDARDATRKLSSDTATLDAGVQAFQGLAAAATIATGVMGLLGTENKDVERAILKVQSAIAILNGVQTIANTLNKDSILMQKLKSVLLAITSKEYTVNTGATTLNTTATTANTVATKAWNVAKAVAKALLGDFSGLLIVGAAALATYAIATSDSKEEEEKATKATKENTTVNQAAAKQAAENITKYDELCRSWKQLANEQQKNQFIKDNTTKFQELGLRIKDLKSAEDMLVANTLNVKNALIARAQAAAAYNKIIQAEEDYLAETLDKEERMNKLLAKQDSLNKKGKGLGAKEAKELNGLKHDVNEAQTKLQSSVNTLVNVIAKANATADSILDDTTKKAENKTSNKKETSLKRATRINTPTTNFSNSASNITAQLKTWQQVYDNAGNEEGRQFAKSMIDSYQSQLDAIKDPTKILNTKVKDSLKDIKVEGKAIEIPVEISLEDYATQVDTIIHGFDDIKTSWEAVGESFSNGDTAWDTFVSLNDAIMQTINSFNSISESVTSFISLIKKFDKVDEASTTAQVANNAIKASSNKAEQASEVGKAAGETMSAHASIPFVGIAIAIGLIGLMMAAMSKFANGGIVPSGSKTGDHNLVRVNGGEMVLNTRQQSNLFRMLNGEYSYNKPTQQNIRFRLRGNDLIGLMDNTTNRNSDLL